MEVKINGRTYPLHFGLGFLNEVNKHESAKMEVEGQTMSTGMMGMQLFNSSLQVYDPVALAKVIQYATSTEQQKPAKKDIEAYVDQLIEKEEYYDVYDELNEELGKQPVVQVAIQGAERMTKKPNLKAVKTKK